MLERSLYPAARGHGLPAAARRRGDRRAVSRIALVPFVIFYATWEVLVGVGVGLLADEVNGLSAAGQLVALRPSRTYADSGLLAVFEMIGMASCSSP